VKTELDEGQIAAILKGWFLGDLIGFWLEEVSRLRRMLLKLVEVWLWVNFLGIVGESKLSCGCLDGCLFILEKIALIFGNIPRNICRNL
jgi:hypothetical protein